MKWSAMEPRERDIQTHQALFPRHNIDGEMYCEGAHHRSQGCEWEPIPTYTTDYNAVAEVRAEIARRGLEQAFFVELSLVVFGLNAVASGQLQTIPMEQYAMRLINATPDQQCLAALRACGVEVEA